MGALLDLIFKAHRGMEGPHMGFGGGLGYSVLEKCFLKDVFNQITTFTSSWEAPNLPETTKNAFFEPEVFRR